MIRYRRFIPWLIGFMLGAMSIGADHWINLIKDILTESL